LQERLAVRLVATFPSSREWAVSVSRNGTEVPADRDGGPKSVQGWQLLEEERPKPAVEIPKNGANLVD
jgi:hypothetical protein